MKIYTSYFSNGKKLKEANIMMIGVALYPPSWYKGYSIRILAPSRDILYNSGGEENYVKRYREEILSKIDAHRIVETISQITNGKDAALCCFEKPDEFCHRHLIAEWLNNNGYDVKEWEQTEKPVKIIMPSLFD